MDKSLLSRNFGLFIFSNRLDHRKFGGFFDDDTLKDFSTRDMVELSYIIKKIEQRCPKHRIHLCDDILSKKQFGTDAYFLDDVLRVIFDVADEDRFRDCLLRNVFMLCSYQEVL